MKLQNAVTQTPYVAYWDAATTTETLELQKVRTIKLSTNSQV